ncbi:MAG: type II toxin-antitoxin system Phd/YefM family antitoxin, partial [Cyanobacteriota bacterium]
HDHRRARAKFRWFAPKAMAHTISASQFKARCLSLMDQVAATGEVWVITKNGRPVAELHPCPPPRRPSPFGLHPGVEIHGNVVAPIDTPWATLE